MAKMGTEEENNIGKYFWSALDYIIQSFREYGKAEANGDFGIDRKSITISKKEWEALDKLFPEFEQAVLDTWEDAAQLELNLTGMKKEKEDLKLDMSDIEEEIEIYRKSSQEMTENIMARLADYVDDDKVT